MSINTYNPRTQKWERTGSTIASGIKVLDAAGNYESENVEGCLSEIKKDLTKHAEEIKYIYENGTIGGGGGGGGGGASMPTLTLESNPEIIVPTNEEVRIQYFFQSPNPGNGMVTITVNNEERTEEIKQGKNSFVVGPFEERGEYKVSIFVIDKASLFSNVLNVSIYAGALQISSKFNQNADFSLEDEIVVPYRIESMTADPVMVELYKDGIKTSIQANIGDNKWEVGRFDSVGVHTLRMKAYNSSLESNELYFSIIISDTDSLFMSSNFDKDQFFVGNRIVIDYRISMKGERRFKTKLFKNGQLFSTVNSNSNDNYWDIGTDTPIGDHVFELESTTLDGLVTSNRLKFEVNVSSEDFIPFKIVEDGLIANFNADGKSNNDPETRHIWQDRTENGTVCTLHNFNWRTNGWIDGALTFGGRTYAEIDLQPLADNVPNGLTFEILYSIDNVGDMEGRVVDFRNFMTPFQGLSINTYEAVLNSTKSKMTRALFQEGIFVRQTFVVDKQNELSCVYTNGAISGISFIDQNENYRFASNIILGARKNEFDEYVNHGACKIKVVRIYNRPLSPDEVLQNHIADIKDRDEQMAIRDLNFDPERIPEMSITGDATGMTNLVEKPMKITYIDHANPSRNFSKDNCLVSWQGTSSLSYPIKNYTIKLRDGGKPFMYSPREDWIPEDRFTIKADFMESSHANNVSVANFADDFFRAQAGTAFYPNGGYPTIAKKPNCRSTVNGFPFRLRFNGVDLGIYNFNIDRYANKTYGFFGEPNCVAYEIGVNSQMGAGAFADDSWESIASEFEYRYHYSGDEGTVTEPLPNGARILKKGYHNDLVNLVSWVKNCTQQEFDSQVVEHFSVPHLIDYYLIVYLFGLMDSLGKNMVLFTLGRNLEGNTIWYPSVYDADTCLSLDNVGNMSYGPNVDMDKGDYNTSDSLLWTKLKNSNTYGPMIKQRYAALRNGAGLDTPWFSIEKILKYFDEGYISNIGQRYYNIDAELKYFTNKGYAYACNGNRLEFTRRWLEERFIYLDSVFRLEDNDNRILFRSNVVGEVELKLKAYSPIKVEVSFSSKETDKYFIEIDKHNPLDETGEGWFTIKHPIENARENDMYITGAHNIMYVGGMRQLQLQSINVNRAYKLVEVDVSNSNYITELVIGLPDDSQRGIKRYLQKLNCSGCYKLGTTTTGKTLDVSQCDNLRYLNCSNTKIGNIEFPPLGGVIEEFDCRNTNITSFNIQGQEYLTEINLQGCQQIAEVRLNNCNALTRFELIGSKLNLFTVTDCSLLNYIDISNTGYLKTLDLSGCTNVRTLKLANSILRPELKDLNLYDMVNLEHIDVSGCSALDGIQFSSNANKIVTFICQNSTIKYTLIGRKGGDEPYPTFVDLSGFPNMESIKFNGCTRLTEVRNLTMKSGGYEIFKDCTNLQKVTGNLTFTGDCAYAFYQCENLRSWPTMNFNGMTSSLQMFTRCMKLDLNVVKTILSTCTSLTHSYLMFNGCEGILADDSTPLPTDLFINCTNIVNAKQMFNGCRGIKAMPMPDEKGGILDPLVNIEDASFMFSHCNIKGMVPPNFFKEGTKLKLKNVAGMFSGNKLDVMVRADLLKYCPELQHASGFIGASKEMVGTIPKGIFDTNGGENNKLIDVSNFFDVADLNGPIPDDLFKYCVQLRNCNSLFQNKNITGSIPENLFENCPELQQCSSMFAGCRNLTGLIPPDLFAAGSKNPAKPYGGELLNISRMFENCSGLGGVSGHSNEIPEGLIHNQRKLRDVSYLFSGCTNLISVIPTTFFKDCKALTELAGVFRYCENLTGTIDPELLVIRNEMGEPIETFFNSVRELFRGCKNLRGEIPENLFEHCMLTEDMSYMFWECYYIQGEIPANLFQNCYKVVTMEGIFGHCYNLGRSPESFTEDDPWCLPPTLFQNCAKLKNASRLFTSYNEIGFSPKFSGHIPPDLFIANPNLENVSQIFSWTKVNGPLDDMLFSRNSKLKNVSDAFFSTNVTTINRDFLSDTKNPLINDCASTFRSCKLLTGEVPTLWLQFPSANKEKCFANINQELITNWDQIPDNWK